jgi:alcohol dehydrogenase class IV
MRFEFATASRIIFGSGVADEVAPAAAQMGTCVLVLTGRSTHRVARILEQLSSCGLEYVTFSIPHEPTITLVKQALELARSVTVEIVISIGGGSVIDTGKAVAAMLTNSGELEDYLEVVGAGKPIINAPVPHIAVPTTAGTGTEVTRNAVIGVPERQVKVSMRSPMMIPTIAVVDPLLTHTMPPLLTASTGLDALTQLIEPFVSNSSNPLADAVCREGLARAARSLLAVWQDGNNAVAREDMALASLFGGLALANARLGAVHGLAGSLGGMTCVPHGLVCGKLLPHVMRANLCALENRDPASPAVTRYDEVAQILTADSSARAADGVAWIETLCAQFKLPSLASFGLTQAQIPAVVAQSQKSSSMKGNPIVLTDQELAEILTGAL